MVTPNQAERADQLEPSETTPALLVTAVGALVSPPEICLKLFELLESPESSANDIALVLGNDPSLSVKLLKLVNSAHFNLTARVDTISRAVAVCGQRELYGLAVAVSALQTFSKIPENLVNMDVFWRHSLYVALLARKLAGVCRVLHPERLFVAGLLHNLGHLLLCHHFPELMRGLLVMAEGDENLLADAEFYHLGYGHGHVAAELFLLWNLPATLQQVAVDHHQTATDDFSLECLIIQSADALAGESLLGSFANDQIEPDEAVSVLPLLAKKVAVEIDSEAVLASVNLEFVEFSSWLLQG